MYEQDPNRAKTDLEMHLNSLDRASAELAWLCGVIKEDGLRSILEGVEHLVSEAHNYLEFHMSEGALRVTTPE